MGGLWTDLQGLERLRSNLDVAAAVLGVVAALVIVVSRWPLARRISHLQSAEKAALVERVRVAESQADAARKSLRSLVAESTIIVAADWSQPLTVGGQVPLALSQDGEFIILSGNEPARTVRLFPTYLKRFNEADGTARVIFRAAVRDGAWPLGESSDVLRGLKPTSVVLPMLSAGDTKTGEGTIRHVDLAIFANGLSIYSVSRDLNAHVTFPADGWRIASTTFPPIE